MIFENLELSDLSPELDIFLWQIVDRALAKNFDLSIDRNYLKVALYQIDFCHVEHSMALQLEI